LLRECKYGLETGSPGITELFFSKKDDVIHQWTWCAGHGFREKNINFPQALAKRTLLGE
jgi:hypothetical protein